MLCRVVVLVNFSGPLFWLLKCNTLEFENALTYGVLEDPVTYITSSMKSCRVSSHPELPNAKKIIGYN